MNKKSKAPKPVHHYSLLDVMTASPTEPLPKENRLYQLTRMYQALKAVEQGDNPGFEDWRLLTTAINMMETLVREMKICTDEGGLVQDAVQAMAAASLRYKKGLPLRLDGPGIKATRAIVEDYASMMETLPARTMISCHRLTETRVFDILFNKKRAAHDVVV